VNEHRQLHRGAGDSRAARTLDGSWPGSSSGSSSRQSSRRERVERRQRPRTRPGSHPSTETSPAFAQQLDRCSRHPSIHRLLTACILSSGIGHSPARTAHDSRMVSSFLERRRSTGCHLGPGAGLLPPKSPAGDNCSSVTRAELLVAQPSKPAGQPLGRNRPQSVQDIGGVLVLSLARRAHALRDLSSVATRGDGPATDGERAIVGPSSCLTFDPSRGARPRGLSHCGAVRFPCSRILAAQRPGPPSGLVRVEDR
jgi:hypothetical protein